MAQMVRAVVVDPSSPQRLGLKPVELSPPRPDEATVRVTAISLNRGEVRRALQLADAGARPGWDFAGVVETAAAGGVGPESGSRVVGLLPSGAWAERVNVPVNAIAALPAQVSDAAAATLPVAELTALHALRQGGLLLGRKVLVDGASGGVGHFACQLAAAAGAQIWGHLRHPDFRAVLARVCGERIVVGPDLAAAAAHGPFHLILDSVGGPALAAALTMLGPGGTASISARRNRRARPSRATAFSRPAGPGFTACRCFMNCAGSSPPPTAWRYWRASSLTADCSRTLRSRRRGPRLAMSPAS
jgi:NADPH:quinone reductase